jgi:Ca2+-binding RTX toxin-like protein
MGHHHGRAGSNVIYGRAGRDLIVGGSFGRQQLSGRASDVVYGGAGADFLGDGPGTDTIHGWETTPSTWTRTELPTR